MKSLTERMNKGWTWTGGEGRGREGEEKQERTREKEDKDRLPRGRGGGGGEEKEGGESKREIYIITYVHNMYITVDRTLLKINEDTPLIRCPPPPPPHFTATLC